MNNDIFYPTVYAKKSCPFSFKVRLFLLEAGLLDRVKVHIVDSENSEGEALKIKLAAHMEKVSFPAAELAPGDYVTDSDIIIERLKQERINHPPLTELAEFVSGPLSQLLALYRENGELKEKLKLM